MDIKVLRSLMQSRGITSYADLSLKIAASKDTVRRMLTAKGGGAIATWERMADFFGVSLDELRGRKPLAVSQENRSPIILQGDLTEIPREGTTTGPVAVLATVLFPGEEVTVVDFAGKSHLILRPTEEHWVCRDCYSAHPMGFHFCPASGRARASAEVTPEMVRSVIRRKGAQRGLEEMP